MKVGDLVRYTCTYSIHQDCLGKIGIVLSNKSDRTGQYKIRVNDKTLYVLNDGTMAEVISESR